jgi:SAM-dependent methyltransferase
MRPSCRCSTRAVGGGQSGLPSVKNLNTVLRLAAGVVAAEWSFGFMIDLTQLPPAEMARHLGRPDGEVGLAVTERLNRVNANITAEAYRRLEPGAGMHVMEIGFGNGHLLPDLLRLAPNLLYSGIDISPTTVGEARRFNAALVNSGRATFHLADAAQIPAADASLDRSLPRRWPAMRPSGLRTAFMPEMRTADRAAPAGRFQRGPDRTGE